MLLVRIQTGRILMECYLTVSIKASNTCPIDPAILLLGIFATDKQMENKLSTEMLSAAQL